MQNQGFTYHSKTLGAAPPPRDLSLYPDTYQTLSRSILGQDSSSIQVLWKSIQYPYSNLAHKPNKQTDMSENMTSLLEVISKAFSVLLVYSNFLDTDMIMVQNYVNLGLILFVQIDEIGLNETDC